MQFHESMIDLIGNTPLVRLRGLTEALGFATGAAPTVLARVETFNPGGSVKDRIALQMIDAAERAGCLRSGSVIVEPTSGKTGVSLEPVAQQKCYNCVFSCPDKVSTDKIAVLRAYGAKVVVCSATNVDFPESHYHTTGQEIWTQTDGLITHFVAGVGAGGTVSGTGRHLREVFGGGVRIIGADPEGSVHTSGGCARRPCFVEGVGQPSLPGSFDPAVPDEIMPISDRDSIATTLWPARHGGIFSGGSGGMAVAACREIARACGPDDVLVVLVPDNGRGYLSNIHGRMSVKRLLEYRDSVAGFHGWLVYDSDESPIAAGGCRVQTQLTAQTLAALAEKMTLKQRVLGINVDGAKCGIAFDPRSDGKADVLRGFLGFLSDELYNRFSMGPDMGTQWGELQYLAAQVGIPSVKYAIRRAQGITDDEFFGRMTFLDEQIGALTLGQRRAGHVLAHTAIGAARAAGATGVIDVALQGFGNLGRAAACTLLEEGVRVIAVSDEYGCLVNPRGLDLVGLLASSQGLPMPQVAVAGQSVCAEEIFKLTSDVLILAANQDAISVDVAQTAPIGAVAVGANYGLGAGSEALLQQRGVVVVPDFIGGIGGSASMEALFGPERCTSAKVVLDNLTRLARDLVDDMCSTARRKDITTTEAAQVLAGRAKVSPNARPYGHCAYLKR